MSNLNDLIKKYTINPNNKIKRLCDPLKSIYNFKQFWYSRTTKSGKLFSTATNSEIQEWYCSSGLIHENPFYRNPKYIPSGFHYYSGVKDEKFITSIDSAIRKYNVEAGLYAFHYKGELHTFGYAIEQSDKVSLMEIITDNNELLKKFNGYFLKELSSKIKIDFDDFVDLPTLMGHRYHDSVTGLRPKLRKQEKSKFLHDIGLLDWEDIQSLSPRELDCLKCIYYGLKAPEAAVELNLSKRTVETYIESIKNKLGCDLKLDLFKVSKGLHLAGFFDSEELN